VAHSLAGAPSATNRTLGILGILGGLVLVAAFIPTLPWGNALFNLRLVLFNAGAIAIIVAVHRRQAGISPGSRSLGPHPRSSPTRGTSSW
jgi:hypothetical protein